MADLNEVRLIGRLTRDPELKSTASGQYVCSFGIATSKKYKGQDGVQREDTTFIDITCWSKLAEIANQYLKKGRQVFIGGRLKLDQWNDKNGERRSKLSVIAENIQFLERNGEDKTPQQEAPKSQEAEAWEHPGQFDEPPF